MENVPLIGCDRVEQSGNSSQFKHRCVVCGNNFAREYDLESHKMGSETDREDSKRFSRCDLCKNKFSLSTSSQIESIVHRTNPDSNSCLKCVVCGQQSSNKYRLKRHMIVHETDPDKRQRFECDVCGHRYTWKSNLIKHMRTHETKPDLRRPFMCVACGQQFARNDNLTRHMRKAHKNDPYLRYSFKSDTCKKTLIRKEDLETHKMNLESATDFNHLFMRNTCDAAFTDPYDMRYPAMIHKSNPESEFCFQSNTYKGEFDKSDLKLKSMHQETNSDLPILGAVCTENLDLNVHTEAQDTSSDLQFLSIGDAPIRGSGFPAALTCDEEWIDDSFIKSLLDFCHST